MNILKVIGGILVLAGIIIPLIQLQALFSATHAVIDAPGSGATLQQSVPGIMAWTVPVNIASPVLIAVGVALLLKERKSKAAD